MEENIIGEQTALGMMCEIVLEVCKDFSTHDNNSNKILHANIPKPLCRVLNALILCY